MKQVYGVILGAAAIAIALYLLWPRLMTPPAPEDPGSASLTTASLVAVSPPSKYEWVDRNQGVARIPIDRAIELVAEKGLPWGKVEPEPEPEPPKVEASPTGESKPAKPAIDPALVQIGQAVFTMYRCAGCHVAGSAYPQLTAKYGTRVNLEGGESALFDDDYIRESILVPNAKISAGYKPIMPAYKDRMTEDEINQVILYIRSIK